MPPNIGRTDSFALAPETTADTRLGQLVAGGVGDEGEECTVRTPFIYYFAGQDGVFDVVVFVPDDVAVAHAVGVDVVIALFG